MEILRSRIALQPRAAILRVRALPFARNSYDLPGPLPALGATYSHLQALISAYTGHLPACTGTRNSPTKVRMR